MSLKSDIDAIWRNANALLTYTLISPIPPDANPSAAAWYELNSGEYVMSTDTSAVEGKNYYLQGFGDCNRYISDEIGRVIKEFVESCTLTPSTPVAGADSSPSGAFEGEVKGISWQITGTTIADILYAACTASNMTDATFAQAFGTALDADVPTWSGSLEGTTTPPSSSPVPSVDSIDVIGIYVSAPVVSNLLSAFRSMRPMYQPGDRPDDVFSTTLASAVITYYTTAILNGKGATHLSGCPFSVTVTAPPQN